VRFSLRGSGPGSVELLDVAGRRLASRELAALGAGRHTVDLDVGERMAPGLYVVRLRHGSDARVMPVTVLK
jgi:hypothetical protein